MITVAFCLDKDYCLREKKEPLEQENGRDLKTVGQERSTESGLLHFEETSAGSTPWGVRNIRLIVARSI